MGCNTRLCSRNLKLLFFWLEFHLSILLIVLSPYNRITSKIPNSTVLIQFMRVYIFTVKLTCPLLWLTHLPWSCITNALLSHINKEFFTLAVLEVNHLQSHAEVANALSGAQLCFSCVVSSRCCAVKKTVGSVARGWSYVARTCWHSLKCTGKTSVWWGKVLWETLKLHSLLTKLLIFEEKFFLSFGRR